jgi:hypothetical protein
MPLWPRRVGQRRHDTPRATTARPGANPTTAMVPSYHDDRSWSEGGSGAADKKPVPPVRLFASHGGRAEGHGEHGGTFPVCHIATNTQTPGTTRHRSQLNSGRIRAAGWRHTTSVIPVALCSSSVRTKPRNGPPPPWVSGRQQSAANAIVRVVMRLPLDMTPRPSARVPGATIEGIPALRRLTPPTRSNMCPAPRAGVIRPGWVEFGR